MRFNFLCARHLDWLQSHPEAAAGTWLQAYDRALQLVADQSFDQAVNHAGAAMQAAETGLACAGTPGHREVSRFAESCLLLAQLLHQVGQSPVASAVIGHAMVTLQDLLTSGADKRLVLDGCKRLARLGDESILQLAHPLADHGRVVQADAARVH